MTEPTRRQKLKPVEYLIFAGVAGVFSGLVTLLGTRQIDLALIFTGVAFIGTLLVIATLMLSVRPKSEEHGGDPRRTEDGGGTPERHDDLS